MGSGSLSRRDVLRASAAFGVAFVGGAIPARASDDSPAGRATGVGTVVALRPGDLDLRLDEGGLARATPQGFPPGWRVEERDRVVYVEDEGAAMPLVRTVDSDSADIEVHQDHVDVNGRTYPRPPTAAYATDAAGPEITVFLTDSSSPSGSRVVAVVKAQS